MTRPSILVSLALTTACTGTGGNDAAVTGPTGEGGDAGIELALTENPVSTLSVEAAVSLEESGTVHVAFWADGVEPLRTPETSTGDVHDLDVVGMRGDTAYTLQAVATLADGTELRSETWGFTSGSVPSSLPDLWVVEGADQDAAITLLGPAEGGAGGGPGGGGGSGADFPYLLGVDRTGEVVWYYEGDDLTGGPDHAGELLDDGTLQVLGDGEVLALTPGTEETWSVPTTQAGSTHHDAVTLPSGHVVVMVQETRTIDVASLGGRVDVVGDVLVELDTSGNEVWSWSTFDHLDTSRFPGAMSQREDDRAGGYDWTHANSLFHVADQDALLLSLRHQNQVVLIDRGTSEILWTLGEDGDFDLQGSGEWFTSQHAATLPNPGEVLLYDNGNEKADPVSRAVRFTIDTDAWTAQQDWDWSADIYTENVGDADALDGGHVLVTAGGDRDDRDDARIAEVDESGDVVWELNVGDGLWVYRAERVDWVRPVE